MEAQKRSSKKRKQSPASSSNSNPFAGILTRHKSQKFFFHHNRSGKSHKCHSFPSSLTNPGLPTKHRLSNCVSNSHDVSVAAGDDETDLISIKDLRARRVFSEPPKSVDVVGKNVNPEFECESIVSKSDESGVKVDGDNILGDNPSLTANEKCDSGVEFKEVLNVENPNLSISEKCDDSGVNLKEVSDDGNPNLSVVEKCVDYSVNLNSNSLNGGNPNLSIEGFGAEDVPKCRVSDDMSPNLRCKDVNIRNGEHCEENVQTTPPDAVVLVRQIGGSDSKSPPKRISPNKGGSGTAEGKKSFSNSRRNLALNPCSKMKVFKAPNSFSYRRMLPFLMDLAKDAPSAPKVNQSIKIETDVEEKVVVSSSPESVIDHCKQEKPLENAVACETQEMSTISKEGEELFLNSKTNDSNDQKTVHCTLVKCPIEKSQENSVCEESQLGTPVSDSSKNVGALLDGQVSIDTIGNSEDISPIIESDLAATLHNTKTNPELTNEDAINASSHQSQDDERKCSASLVEFTPEEYPISVFSQMEAAVSPDEQGFCLAKGILKRNPRGCRGVCNCLSCASFRLNAEKAFEFSRNQWLDAEELAIDLMKEISSIRDMLEKNVSEANDNAIVPVDQVQELCRRASMAEDTARSRLNQMKEELHAHCRIKQHLQRPRVSFSKSVQEKIVRTTKRRR